MTSLHPARRNAERFDALVEAGRLDGVDARTAELLELVGALRAVPPAEPRPEFTSDLRERLMLAARTELVPVGRTPRDAVAERLTVKPARTRRERRIGIALGAIAVVGATSSMAVASQGAVAGDALYPIKRAIESTQAGFSVSDQAKGHTMLGTASGRLDEVGELSRRDDPDAALVRSTLQAFADQATQASDLLMSDYEQTGHEASIEQLHAFTASSMTTLGELDATIPEAAEPALLEAAQALFTIDAAAEQVCPACAGDGITEIPGQLLASAETSADEGTGTLAGGALTGTQPTEAPAEVASPAPVSGIDPPEVPVQIPTELQLPPLTETPGTGTEGQTGQQGNQGQQGNGHQGKPKPTKPVDLSGTLEGVTGTVEGTVGGVNDVVGGVVQGVTGLLGGLTGQPTPTPPG